MNCSPFDLRDYFFEELGSQERGQVESHLRGCQGCREEFDRLRAARHSLLRLTDEEIPRRIAFVSDPVFERSGARRWWAAMRAATPKFAFTAALLLGVCFGGLRIARPTLTVENGRWQISFASAEPDLESRQAAQMRNLEQTYELLVKQMNVFYSQSAAIQMQPAAFRQ